jgi:hypothetical protein
VHYDIDTQALRSGVQLLVSTPLSWLTVYRSQGRKNQIATERLSITLTSHSTPHSCKIIIKRFIVFHEKTEMVPIIRYVLHNLSSDSSVKLWISRQLICNRAKLLMNFIAYKALKN